MLTLLSTLPAPSPQSGAQDGSVDGRVVLPPADRERLERWVRSSTTTQRLAVRSVIVLLAGAGLNDAAIAAELLVTRRTVVRWRTRYMEGGLRALTVDRPGRGRKPGRHPGTVGEIVRLTREERRDDGRPWSVRSLAARLGISHATVQRVWKEQGLSGAGGDAAAARTLQGRRRDVNS